VGVVKARVSVLTALGPTGRVAAQNMLAQEAEISTVPYLWTAMFGKSLRYAGNQESRGGRGLDCLEAGPGWRRGLKNLRGGTNSALGIGS
jgi:hypothetical protein